MDNQNNNLDSGAKEIRKASGTFEALKKMNGAQQEIGHPQTNAVPAQTDQSVGPQSRGKTTANAKTSASPKQAKAKPIVLQESEAKDNLMAKLQAWWQKLRASARKENVSSQTNLVKDRAVVFIDWQRYLISLLNSFLIALIILGMAYGYLLLLGEQKMQQVKTNAQKLDELNKQIAGVEESMDDVFSFQRKIKLVKTLINNHIYWTNFFTFLEKNTLPNVYYSGFSGDIDGQYKLEAQTNSFTSIANQLLILKQNPYVIEAKTNGGDISYTQVNSSSEKEQGSEEDIMPAITQSSVSFDLELKIKPDIFFE